VSYERRDPDDPDRHGEPTASDVDAAFAQIVARWNDDRPQWPADHPADDPARRGGTSGTGGTIDATVDGRHDTGFDPALEAALEATPTDEIPAQDLAEPLDDDDDHYVPPEPPPLPRPQPATLGAVLLLALGIVMVAFPQLIGMSDQYGLPLGLLCFTGAIVWLVARLRQGPPNDSGWDDGARL
jgi:hypothetical protein